MKRLAGILVLFALAAGCGMYEGMTVVDKHGDQHLWYRVWRVDYKQGVTGKYVSQGPYRWEAKMSPSNDPKCAASNDLLMNLEVMDCGMARINGEAPDPKAAVEIVQKHFEMFVANNRLVMQPRDKTATNQ